MGLSIVLSSAIVFFTVFVVFGTYTNFTNQIFEISQASTKISSIENNYANTKISIQSLNVGNSNFTVNLINDGKEKVYDFQKFDVIVSYNGNLNHIIDELIYSQCPINAGYWCINSITNDYLDPNILNANETAVIRGNTTDIINPGGLSLSITTDNGHSISRSIIT